MPDGATRVSRRGDESEIFAAWQGGKAADEPIEMAGDGEAGARLVTMPRRRVAHVGMEQRFEFRPQQIMLAIEHEQPGQGRRKCRLSFRVGLDIAGNEIGTGIDLGEGRGKPIGRNDRVGVRRGDDGNPIAGRLQPRAGLVHRQAARPTDMALRGRQLRAQQTDGELGMG
jgi:hypothetical protein